jgi:hypothetical protein
MAQEMIKVHMKNRKVVEIPQTNLANFKRLFFAQIDYVEEQEGEPIIAKPVIEEIKKPVVESVSDSPKADEKMSKKELQELAKDLDGYKPSLKKSDLVKLING